ncbi:MAG: cphB 2 [Schlesneria sp.]|nr:cphB 2 [Schlesneria sp.]
MTLTAPSRWGTLLVAVVMALQWLTTADAQRFDEQFSNWPVHLTITGRILVDNDVQEWDGLKPVLERVAKDRSVICFRRESASSSNLLAEALKAAVGDEGSAEVTSFTTLPLDDLKAALSSADVVVIQAGEQVASDLPTLLKLKPQFDEFLADGRTLIVDKAVATLLGKVVLSKAMPKGDDAGLNLFPDSVLLCDFDENGASQADLMKAVTSHPRTVGIGIQRGVMLMLSGRKVTCHGSGRATFVLPGRDHGLPRIETISPATSRRQTPQEALLDLTEWRRDAIDRTLEPFPGVDVETPFVDNGTLVIVGGGGMPRGLMSRFVELAGGNEHARLVYVPCAEEIDVSQDQGTVQGWKKMGVEHATSIHTKDRQQANTDDEFLASLKDATGIWFGGGRQWNLADSYYGTKAQRMMKEVLHRGGVIGGSSAGASIQARYLARATPIGNFNIMAPGYERGGLGFIGGVAIDQHFTQRGRHKDLTQLVSRYPQLLGIGLDEATAIVVQKSIAEVVGNGKVFFYDSQRPVVADEPDYVALPKGSSYDLAKRAVLVDATGVPVETESEPKIEESESQ